MSENPNYFQHLLHSNNDPDLNCSENQISSQNPVFPISSPPSNIQGLNFQQNVQGLNFQYNPYFPSYTVNPYNMPYAPHPNISHSQQYGGIAQFGLQSVMENLPNHKSSPSTLGRRKEKNLAPIDVTSNKRVVWTVEEDKVLISAYLNTSRDPILGTDQSARSFWSKVTKYYDDYKGCGINRDLKSCKNRWHLINGLVSKFVGVYKQAKARKRSGESENDVFIAAQELYQSDMGKTFNLDHAWCMLKDDPKWLSIGEDSSSKRTKINVQGHCSSSSDPGTPCTPNTPNTPIDVNSPEVAGQDADANTDNTPNSNDVPQVHGDTNDVPVMVRPIGVKAAKRKSKMKVPDEGLAVQRGLMDDFVKAQTKMANAMDNNVRMKKLELYSKFVQKEMLSEREEFFF